MSFEFSPEAVLFSTNQRIQEKESELRMAQQELARAQQARPFNDILVTTITGNIDRATRERAIAQAPEARAQLTELGFGDLARNNRALLSGGIGSEINRIRTKIRVIESELSRLKQNIPTIQKDIEAKAGQRQQGITAQQNLTNQLSALIDKLNTQTARQRESAKATTEKKDNTLRNAAIIGGIGLALIL